MSTFLLKPALLQGGTGVLASQGLGLNGTINPNALTNVAINILPEQIGNLATGVLAAPDSGIAPSLDRNILARKIEGGSTVNSELSRTPSFQEKALAEQLMGHISTNFVGINIATFGANEYTPNYEAVLRSMGVDTVVITDPSAYDLELARNDPGFFHKPTKVMWRAPVQSWEDYLASLNSKNRNRLKAKLKKSEAVIVRYSPLTSSQFEKWYPLYESEVVGKEKGQRLIDPDWARARENREDIEPYWGTFFYAPESNELIGGAIVKYDKKKGVAMIAYAAYNGNFSQAELSIRTFYEVIEHSRQNGFHQISYGMDSNLFGEHLSMGLMEYKASLGFRPVPGKGRELLKILNPEKLDKEYFFFALNGNEELHGEYFTDNPHKIVAPAGMNVRENKRTAEAFANLKPLDATDLLSSVESLEHANKLWALFVEVYCAGRDNSMRSKAYPDAFSDPFYFTLSIVELLRQGYGTIEHFLELAHARGLIKKRVKEPSLGTGSLSSSDYAGREATVLGRTRDPHFWQALIIELAAHEFGDIEVLENISFKSSPEMLRGIFDNIKEKYGEKGLLKFLVLLRGVHALDITEADATDPEPTESPLFKNALTLDDLPLAEYFPAGDVAAARQLIEKLYKLILGSHFATLHKVKHSFPLFKEAFVETLGERAVAHIKHFLDYPDGWNEAIRDIELHGYGRDMKEALIDLYALTVTMRKIAMDSTETRFGATMGNLYDSQGELEEFLIQNGLNPSNLKLKARRPDEVFAEIYRRTSKGQKLSLIGNAKAVFKGRSEELSDIEREVLNFQEEGVENPLPVLSIDLHEYKRVTELLQDILVDSSGDPSTVKLLQEMLGVRTRPYFGSTPHTIACELVHAYISVHGGLPQIDNDIRKNILVNRVSKPGGIRAACIWLLSHPDRNMIGKIAPALFDNFHLRMGDSDTHIYWFEEIFMLFKLLSDKSFSEQAQKVFRNFPRHFEIFYSRERSAAQLKEFTKELLADQNVMRLVKSEMISLMDRYVLERQEMRSGYRTLSDSFSFALDLLTSLGQLDELWPLFAAFSKIVPHWALRQLADFRDNGGLSSFGDFSKTNQMFLSILGSIGNELVLRNNEGRPILPFGIDHFNDVPWPAEHFIRPSLSILLWAESKCQSDRLSNDEIGEIIFWVIDHSDITEIGEKTVLALDLIKYVKDRTKRLSIYSKVKERLGQRVAERPFNGSETYSHISKILENIDPMGGHDIGQEILWNRNFIERHPWQAYGYSEDVVSRVRAFATDPYFTWRHADLLTDLLLSHNGKSFNRIWISQLILSTPERSFQNLVRFLEYWSSLSPKDRDRYLGRRVEDLLAEVRARVAKECLGAGYYAAKKLVSPVSSQGSHENGGLKIRVEMLERFRSLFSALARAQTPEAEAKLHAEINHELMKFKPPKLLAENEIRLLLDAQYQSFMGKIRLDNIKAANFRDFMTRHFSDLSRSGIMDRFVQFAGFADQHGLERLEQVVSAYSDPAEARVVEIEHPELGGMVKKHFDYHGKFREFEALLLERGVAKDEVERFIERWSQLWYFQKVEGLNNAYLSATHDLERWCKHGEEPGKTCQRISSHAGEMSANNWNYQFGPYPNADGRPLARILLPQLNLVEYRENGRLIARTVVEVTVRIRNGVPEIALLVEAAYPQGGSMMSAQIKRYARFLGISENNIFDVNVGLDMEDIPPLLPEKYRIYRDTFRPR